MAIREYRDCVLCDETPFDMPPRWVRDPDDDSLFPKLIRRMCEGRLQVRPDKMIAKLSTPNGVQVLWQHGGMKEWGEGQSIGRVRDMAFANGTLLGTILLSEADVAKFVAGGLEAVEAGINAGISVRILYLDNPPFTLKEREGTREKPDQITYGAVRITEVSLTPMPRLYNAGLGKRFGGGDDEAVPEMETDE